MRHRMIAFSAMVGPSLQMLSSVSRRHKNDGDNCVRARLQGVNEYLPAPRHKPTSTNEQWRICTHTRSSLHIRRNYPWQNAMAFSALEPLVQTDLSRYQAFTATRHSSVPLTSVYNHCRRQTERVASRRLSVCLSVAHNGHNSQCCDQ